MARYLRPVHRRGDPGQRWLAFLQNHREGIAAFDFFTVPTVTFQLAIWVVQQLGEAFPGADPYRYVVLDRDSKFDGDVVKFLKATGLKPKRTSVQAPWQNGLAERWVGSCRREIFDHVIALNEQHLRRLIRDYVNCHHDDRCLSQIPNCMRTWELHLLRRSSPALVLEAIVASLRASFRRRAALQLEILALRHQLGVLQRSPKRPRLTTADRFLWTWLSRVGADWRSALVIVKKPETVIAWHRKGFRLFWTWKVRHGTPGRPAVPEQVRAWIRQMSRENPLWGAPRIHGELPKLGIDVGETSVGKYLVRNRKL